MVSAKAGLAPISTKIVTPAGTDLYNEVVSDVPMRNNIGITTISPIDHLPNVVFGEILQDWFCIRPSFNSNREMTPPQCCCLFCFHHPRSDLCKGK